MITKLRFCFSILLPLAITLLISGCWDQVEIKERSIVVGMGIDKTVDGSVLLTTQVVNLSSSKGKEGTTGGNIGTGAKGSSQGGSSVSILTSTGKSFYEAIHNFLKSASRRITFSHNRIILFGKALAGSGIANIVDDLARDYQFRRTNWLLVAENTAEEILRSETGLGTIPAREIDQMLRNITKEPLVPPVILNDFLIALKSEGVAAFVPIVELDKSGPDVFSRIKIEKTAIFKNDRFCGVLNTDESQGLLWLVAKQKGGSLAVPYKSNNGPKPIWIELSEGATHIRPQITPNKILMEITCTGKGTIRETEDFNNNLKTVQQLEIKTANIMRQQVHRTIRKAQMLNADIFGFATLVHDEYPEHWRSLRDNWESAFPRIQTKVGFQINIASFGIIKNSLLKNNRQE